VSQRNCPFFPSPPPHFNWVFFFHFSGNRGGVFFIPYLCLYPFLQLRRLLALLLPPLAPPPTPPLSLLPLSLLLPLPPLLSLLSLQLLPLPPPLLLQLPFFSGQLSPTVTREDEMREPLSLRSQKRESECFNKCRPGGVEGGRGGFRSWMVRASVVHHEHSSSKTASQLRSTSS
jgi:hypothetical protein